MGHGGTFEFFGPRLGPSAIMLGLPLVCYGLVYACNEQGCMQMRPQLYVPGFREGTRLFSWEGVAAYLGFLAFQVVLHLALPGQRLHGTELPNGSRLTYKLTGLSNLAVTLAATAALAAWTDALAWVHANFLPLLTAAVGFSFLLSAACYAASFRRGTLLASHGSSGYHVYDFFMGRELNPRIGSLDLKEFIELYPGLIGWVVLNAAATHTAHQRDGGVAAGLLLVNAFQLLYVVDALWFEPAILTTMDITTDGFGFMLAFGNLAWVPFSYCLQSRFLAHHPQVLSWPAIVGILLLKAVGYLTFRGANSQKDLFRKDPNHPKVRGLQTIETARGRHLLVSGWWGIARHINYFGDWLMSLAWCLPCGFSSIIPYFYAIYFAVLLVHRDRRDDSSCRLKYGKDWDRYTSIVKYRIVPMLY